ncbi:hypothetical protein QJS10_CPB13g01063 [Acorus calamus]|uniref:RNase H type-1 domain-containing protein n=1 Tax=Acorus calamus TaxID=4465 RepID=A0AAV9DGB7_ACOCL|nr:hypothetical protein QJS10_CPB13g01063 [Acorus calamus]
MEIVAEWNVQIEQKTSSTTFIKWLPLEPGWVKANSNGALTIDRAGYGALLRSHTGKFLAGVAAQVPRASINILELKGILAGISLAILQGSPNLWIGSDSATAISWVNAKGFPPWTALQTLCSINHSLASFVQWKATHIGREANQPADLLASWYKQDGLQLISAGATWEALTRAIRLDAEGTAFPRIKQFVHCEVHLIGSRQRFSLTFIYALNLIAERQELWTDLQQLAQQISGPWLVGGDFNKVRFLREKQGGRPLHGSMLAWNAAD